MCAEYLLHHARPTVISGQQSDDPVPADGVANMSSEALKPDFYAMLYEFHGDALAAQLPAMYDCFQARPRRSSPVLAAWDDPTVEQSGDQLLQQFLDQVPRRSDSDRGSVVLVRSDRSSSVSSGCADLGDMTVKETVSDPSHGIRLTILKKKPKLQPESDSKAAAAQPSGPSSTPQSKAKELKKSPTKGIPTQKVKVGLGEAFEDLVPFKRKQDIMFVFKFQGREQRCLPLLARWGIGGRSTVSWYQVLCRRLPRVARRTRKSRPSSQSEHLLCARTAGLCTLDLARSLI